MLHFLTLGTVIILSGALVCVTMDLGGWRMKDWIFSHHNISFKTCSEEVFEWWKLPNFTLLFSEKMLRWYQGVYLDTFCLFVVGVGQCWHDMRNMRWSQRGGAPDHSCRPGLILRLSPTRLCIASHSQNISSDNVNNSQQSSEGTFCEMKVLTRKTWRWINVQGRQFAIYCVTAYYRCPHDSWCPPRRRWSPCLWLAVPVSWGLSLVTSSLMSFIFKTKLFSVRWWRYVLILRSLSV